MDSPVDAGQPDTDLQGVGLEPVNHMAFYGIVAPKVLTPAIVDKLNAATRKVLEDAALRKRVEDTGSQIVAGTPADFAQQIRAEFGVYRKVVQAQRLALD